MKQFHVIAFCLVALLAAPMTQAQLLPGSDSDNTPNDAHPDRIDRIVAVAGEDIILQSELDQALRSVHQRYANKSSQLPPKNVLKRQVLDRLILMKLQVQRAARNGIHVSNREVQQAVNNVARQQNLSPQQLRQRINGNGGSFATFQRNMRQQVTVQKLRQKVIHDRVQVSDSEVENLLNSASFHAGRVRLQHIVIQLPQGAGPDQIKQAQQKANKARQAITDGMDFQKAAIRFSDAQDALDGGDLGWMGMNEIPRAFGNLVSKMDVGNVSKPLRGPSGFHIIKVLDKDSGDHDVVTQYRVSQILIEPDELLSPQEAQKKAHDLYQQITEEDADFGDLARDNSDDDTSANLGGDLGWMQLKAHGPAIAKALRNLDKGQVSKPFQTPAGIDIIKLKDKRRHDVTDKKQRQRARREIGNRKAKQTYQDFLRQLRSSSFVDIRVPALQDPDKDADQESKNS